MGCKKYLFSFMAMLILANGYLYAYDSLDQNHGYKADGNGQISENSPDEGLWIINADSRNNHEQPELGRSLFDIIFSTNTNEGGAYQIPFPFESLVDKIRKHLHPDDLAIKKVQIPLGRSLRREAGAPEYFNHPRYVVAVDAQPRSINGQAGLNLDARLFLGYQEQSNVLEIISYNPEQGRFEFQEVYDYAEGMKPVVKYANRSLCISCHQNAGPIFPKEPWLETDSNKDIKALLSVNSVKAKANELYLPRFDQAWAIDYATDRANYFSSSQFIWQQACASINNHRDESSIRCRAGMLTSMLQFRLLGVVDQRHPAFSQWMLPLVQQNWQKKWPDGLLVASADIEDRNPFSQVMLASQDPLNPRQPRAKWLTPSAKLLTGIIYQSAAFFTEPDIFAIDKFLQRQAALNQLPEQIYHSSCTLARSADIFLQKYYTFSCESEEQTDILSFDASGLIVVNNNVIDNGNIGTLNLTGHTRLRFLDFGKAVIKQDANYHTVVIPLNKHKTRLGSRLNNGRLIKQLELKWPRGLKEFEKISDLKVRLLTVDDIGPLYNAIEDMIQENIKGEDDALALKPIRRHRILKSLHDNLGMLSLAWSEYKKTTYFSTDKTKSDNVPDKSLLPFYQYCSSCHQNTDNYPIGFLSGSALQVKGQIKQCAQQILARLSMWKVKSGERLYSAMPPHSWIQHSGMTEKQWLSANKIELMQTIITQLLNDDREVPSMQNEDLALCR